ncbi:MAG: PEBP-like protein [Candidatus Obscuribacterales bacterium]|nr:PEBP-like protein [Candidatus Obscuribacterales bacterium]
MQTDIPDAPLVRWEPAQSGKLYTLMMLDLDGDALGSYPDPVPVGSLAPLRHWIVGNIPGKLLAGSGYEEKNGVAEQNSSIAILMPYRAPHIRMVSDRYGLYLFEQKKAIDFAELPADNRKNFDYQAFLKQYDLGKVKAANHFVSIYISESPFSGKPFHGMDVSQHWHQTLGEGKLAPSE